MRREKKGGEEETEKARRDVFSNDAREKEGGCGKGEAGGTGQRMKKGEREKGRLAEGRENPGRGGGRAGIVAPCLA